MQTNYMQLTLYIYYSMHVQIVQSTVAIRDAFARHVMVAIHMIHWKTLSPYHDPKTAREFLSCSFSEASASQISAVLTTRVDMLVLTLSPMMTHNHAAANQMKGCPKRRQSVESRAGRLMDCTMVGQGATCQLWCHA